jgi:hypothetical protein
VALFALGPLAAKFEDAQQNDPADYLPAKAESVKTIDRLDRFRSDGEADAITVFHPDGGLTANHRDAIEQLRHMINERIRPSMNAVRRNSVGTTAPARVSADAARGLLRMPITVPETPRTYSPPPPQRARTRTGDAASIRIGLRSGPLHGSAQLVRR